MNIFEIAGLFVPPMIGGTAWLWHLGVKVAVLENQAHDIIDRLGRIERLLDSLVKLSDR